MGFSWGGVVTMLTATTPYTDLYLGTTLQFKALAPLYPLLEQAIDASAPGVLDVTMVPDATRAFDRNEPEITVVDLFSHLGAGGEVVFRYNPQAAMQARAALVAFFLRTL